MGERQRQLCDDVSLHTSLDLRLLTTISGDSCHPMLPYLAQGANSSMEDGAVLGLLLGDGLRQKPLRDVLQVFQQLRKARGEAIVRETFKQVRQNPSASDCCYLN